MTISDNNNNDDNGGEIHPHLRDLDAYHIGDLLEIHRKPNLGAVIGLLDRIEVGGGNTALEERLAGNVYAIQGRVVEFYDGFARRRPEQDTVKKLLWRFHKAQKGVQGVENKRRFFNATLNALMPDFEENEVEELWTRVVSGEDVMNDEVLYNFATREVFTIPLQKSLMRRWYWYPGNPSPFFPQFHKHK